MANRVASFTLSSSNSPIRRWAWAPKSPYWKGTMLFVWILLVSGICIHLLTENEHTSLPETNTRNISTSPSARLCSFSDRVRMQSILYFLRHLPCSHTFKKMTSLWCKFRWCSVSQILYFLFILPCLCTFFNIQKYISTTKADIIH